jgi:hypothetical protein
LVSRNWQTEGELVQVIVARRSLHGEIAAAAFMVDTGCLGVKSAVVRLLHSASEYERGFRAELMRSQPLQSADFNLAAKIIREAVGYARELGFHPDPDYKTAALLLAGADPDACPEHVPLGKDGKPFYCAGPYDKVPKVLAQLAQAVGADNFQYFVPMSDPSAFVDDDDASGLRRLLGNTVGRLLR